MDERRSQRFATMDGLRGVAALGVMLYHFHQPDRSGKLAALGTVRGRRVLLPQRVRDRLSVTASAPGPGAGRSVLWARARHPSLPDVFRRPAAGPRQLSRPTVTAGGSGQCARGSWLSPRSMPRFCCRHFCRSTSGSGSEQTNRVLFPFNGPAWSLFDELLCNALFRRFLRPHGLAASCDPRRSDLSQLVVTAQAADGAAGWGRLNWWAGPPRALFGLMPAVGLHDLWRKRASQLWRPVSPGGLLGRGRGRDVFVWDRATFFLASGDCPAPICCRRFVTEGQRSALGSSDCSSGWGRCPIRSTPRSFADPRPVATWLRAGDGREPGRSHAARSGFRFRGRSDSPQPRPGGHRRWTRARLARQSVEETGAKGAPNIRRSNRAGLCHSRSQIFGDAPASGRFGAEFALAFSW